jgi:hypothetical protein
MMKKNRCATARRPVLSFGLSFAFRCTKDASGDIQIYLIPGNGVWG